MNEEINNINTQIAFTSALLFAISLNIYASIGYKDLIINKKNSRFTIKKLYEIGLLSACITLIVTIYFLIITYESYENNPSNASFSFYMASALSFTAQSIRISALIKYPNDIFGVEDFI